MLRLGLDAGGLTFTMAAEHGIKGVPISADQLVNEGVKAVLASLRSRGLEVCQIGAFGFNPLYTQVDPQDEQKALIAKAVSLAADTGCPYIVIHSGNYNPAVFQAADSRTFTPQALDHVARELESFIRLAEKHKAKLSIEPYLKTAVHSPESFLALHRRLASDALCCNIDVTSLYTYHEMWNPSPAVDHICSALAGHYGLVHIKDVILKEGFHIHIELGPLGSTPTDWAQFLRLAAPHIPADSWVILEHVQSMEEGRASMALLRRVARDAGVELA